MTDRVRPIPEGYSTVTPYLIVQDAARAIEFYQQAFGATELFRMARPDGRVHHAEIQLGDSRVMLTDEYAPSFWVLADAHGNQACVCTGQDRQHEAGS